ncbi:ATP-binding protein, partial [Streptomyces boncukensis]|uniref:ATP-binding protein n=1 Tax=Streptomyces boncukensis TaxID=2711219 RepID=UPI0019D0894B
MPGAPGISTRQAGEVAEALVHTAAARAVPCLYGDPGQGRTVALHQALRLLPRRLVARPALVAVKPALPQLRAALLEAFGHSALSLPLARRAEAADRALLDALSSPGVLVIDDAQRIAPAELDDPWLLADAPPTQTCLVQCGAGAEHTLARAPALASRVLTWQHTPRLDAAQVPGVLRLFHPVWDLVPPGRGRGRGRRPAARGRCLRAGQLPHLGEDHLTPLRRPGAPPPPGPRRTARCWSGPAPASAPPPDAFFSTTGPL